MKHLAMVGLLAGMLAACAPAPDQTAGKLDIVASIPPLAYLAEKIGGPGVAVETLLQPGQEPHTFEAKPRHIERVLRAKILAAIGLLPFERQLLDRIAALPVRPEIVECARGIPLRPFVEYEFEHAGHEDAEHGGHEHDEHDEHEHDGHEQPESVPGDPHVWLDPGYMIQFAEAIAAALSAAAPEKAAYFQANLEELVKTLRAVDNAAREQLQPWKGRGVLVFHPAFGYFLDRYGLHQRAVEANGKQPAPKQLRELIQIAREENTRVIFAQPQFDPRAARLIAEQIQGKVITLDSMPADPVANFDAMTSAIAASFAP